MQGTLIAAAEKMMIVVMGTMIAIMMTNMMTLIAVVMAQKVATVMAAMMIAMRKITMTMETLNAKEEGREEEKKDVVAFHGKENAVIGSKDMVIKSVGRIDDLIREDVAVQSVTFFQCFAANKKVVV